MNGNNIALRIVSALVLLAAIAGIGFFAFRAGVAQGSPVIIQAPSGETVTTPYMYPGYEFGHTRFFFPFGFGCFGPLLALFLLFTALRASRFLFWGPRWGRGHHHHGPWGWHWGGGVPPMFNELHKRAHDNSTEGEKE